MGKLTNVLAYLFVALVVVVVAAYFIMPDLFEKIAEQAVVTMFNALWPWD